MNRLSQPPLVSIVTPVYNGGRYLDKCVESVQEQTYRNWEYIIVNNCSTDETLKVASKYAQWDSRIRIVTNERFVGIIENHNTAFRLISPLSVYCKVVSADDYLFPECIQKLVEVGENNPRVAIVGSYAINDEGVHCIGLSTNQSILAGCEMCRLFLLGSVSSFGTPSTLLYRSKLIRSTEPFYPGNLPNGDGAACMECLKDADFAFVHQILSYERIHDEALSTGLRRLNSFLIDRLQFLRDYGPVYLSQEEIENTREKLLKEAERCLAVDVINLRWIPVWKYQRERLKALGCPLRFHAVLGAVLRKLADLSLNPKQTVEKVLARMCAKCNIDRPHSMSVAVRAEEMPSTLDAREK